MVWERQVQLSTFVANLCESNNVLTKLKGEVRLGQKKGIFILSKGPHGENEGSIFDCIDPMGIGSRVEPAATVADLERYFNSQGIHLITEIVSICFEHGSTSCQGLESKVPCGSIVAKLGIEAGGVPMIHLGDRNIKDVRNSIIRAVEVEKYGNQMYHQRISRILIGFPSDSEFAKRFEFSPLPFPDFLNTLVLCDNCNPDEEYSLGCEFFTHHYQCISKKYQALKCSWSIE